MKRSVVVCLTALVLPFALRADAPNVYAIRGARIVTAAGAPIDSGTIVIRRGTIEAVGASVNVPSDAEVLDGNGLTVYPGLIDLGNTRAADQPAPAQNSPPVFDGGKSTWHDDFVRYDFLMDKETFEITPFTRPDNERFGVGTPPAGKLRCIVVVPKNPAPGNPWSWQACYWDHRPQAEVELLRRGFGGGR